MLLKIMIYVKLEFTITTNMFVFWKRIATKAQRAHSRSADAELRGSDFFTKKVFKSAYCTFVANALPSVF
jgi:hypothetical protein